MARHRSVRTMNYEDEFFDDDDVEDCYGQSFDDKYCISPGTVAQFTFPRKSNLDLGSYISSDSPSNVEPPIITPDSPKCSSKKVTYNSFDEARLNHCLDKIHEVLGDIHQDDILVECIKRHKYDTEAALNELLATPGAPKPQRQPREGRKSQAAKKDVLLSKNLKDGSSCKSSADQQPDSSEVTTPLTTKSKQNSSNDNKLTCSLPTPVTTVTDATLAADLMGVSEVNGLKKDGLCTPCKDGSRTPNKEGSLTPRTARRDVNDRPMGLPKSSSRSKYEKLDLKKEYEKRQEGRKELINLVVIGHVDAGKSTLMGHLLYQLGTVNKRLMHKFEQESKKLGKGSFAYAWVLDETEEERNRGVTMDVAQTMFETSHKTVTLLDAPGHKDFIPNMITGTAQADAAILVVNATRGEFETGFLSGGQTREHALLARSLGISQLIVCVNKMDTVDWSEERYNEIVKKLGTFLKQAGYRDKEVSFVPCSGLEGENLIKPVSQPELAAWYNGNCLLEQIDEFYSLDRAIDSPFRLCISDVFKGLGSGFCVSGKVCTGGVQNGDVVLLMPNAEKATVKGITLNDEPKQCAFAGDHIILTLVGIDMNNVSVGNFLCDASNPMKSATKIRAKVVVFNIEVPITRGYPSIFHYQSTTEPVLWKRLICQIHKSTGEIIKNRPKCLGKNSSAVVELEFERPLCIELYKEFKELGRFMIRYSGHTIAAGLVEEILNVKT
ncbi:HBS1-like protein isoform X2 [Octopus bimaculoides]|uniref:Tr-type G domain-containing protein n=1 Tax=Octopus bimaculoides TaxID=37653 RepID=A0A0L8FNM7_OCTBM|nr:HBS1-like protein isoform X2 [Octopus bimaculoides]|eukprot:XP_014788283.1 PREDICTED: HBS1-like protein isoform X2 [Octopus bimaculoides]